MKAELLWKAELQFECLNGKHKMAMDFNPQQPENAVGPSPKEFLLNAMMGCTAMDAMVVLKKMRQNVTGLKIAIDAQKNEKHPIHFIHALTQFYFEGELEAEKVIKAVDMSLHTYCGVNYAMSKTCKIDYEVYLGENKIHQGVTDFTEAEKNL